MNSECRREVLPVDEGQAGVADRQSGVMGDSWKGECVVPENGLLEQSLDVVAQGLAMTRPGLTMEMVREGEKG